MKKKISFLIGVLIVVGGLWYLFLKPYDYLVRFKVKASPGTINQTIKLWANNADNTEFIKQNNLNQLILELQSNDSIDIYEFKTSYLNDSISQVKVYITDEEHSFKNKLVIPFTTSVIEKRSKNNLNDLLSKLDEHTKKIKVTILGEETTPETYCVYVSAKTSQFGKAGQMMRYYPLLDGLMMGSGIKTNGRPFIQVNEWNMETDSITFDFCYPIIKTDSLPEHPDIKYKQVKKRKALKAIYNGNYITSDRAWYSLVDYALKNNYAIEKKPIEVFQSNPNYGGNELDWKAEIYMPLAK